MRRQCLFDPNHLIDEYGFNKHLLECRSKLKKDWRMCRYDDTHWHLYHQIQFHQKHECPMNPLCIQNPKEFHMHRQQEIRKIQKEIDQKKNFKMDSILSELKEQSSSEQELSFFVKQPMDKINFGEISVIESNIKEHQSASNISQNKTLQNHSILDLHEALNFDENSKPRKNLSVVNQSHNSMMKKSLNSISMKDQEMFQKGIVETKKRWQQPEFERFELDFRKMWQLKKQQENDKKLGKEEEKGQRSFEEEIEDLQMSLQNISSKYNDIDYD